MTSAVTEIPAAASAEAHSFFARKFAFETDCADVWGAFQDAARLGTAPDFVLLDVRGRSAFAKAHIPGATNLPHRDLTPSRLSGFPADTLFVVYCAGPHCNGADRAALRLSSLGRPVKTMPGGMTGWADEGFGFESAANREAAAS